MLRLAYLLVAVTGCDAVFGLERGTVDDVDEDGDGIANSDDPCPHITSQSATDFDGDGVSADCDPDDHDKETTVMFVGFDDPAPLALTYEGSVETSVPGTIGFGSLGNELNSIVVRDLAIDNVLIDVGFEVLASSIEAGGLNPYDELGVYASHRSFADFPRQRGDTCFFGRDQPEVEPLFVEMDEDDMQHDVKTAAGTLGGTVGRLRMRRTPMRADCTVFRDGLGLIPNGFDVAKLIKVPGTVAVTTQSVKVRFRYLYIAYQPLSPL